MYTKFISCLLFFSIFSSSCYKKQKNISELFPEYKLLTTFLKKISPKTDLILRSYGVNYDLPKDYVFKNGVANFTVSYSLQKQKQDEISIDYARSLLISLTHNLLEEINNNSEVQPHLDVFPLTANLLNITIHFEDENRVDLGQGIAIVYFRNGKIKYEGYDIREYTGSFPARGNHFTIYKESYEEALDVVQKNGALVLF
jgi:hypothetical protein